jgi:hypothetical protein
LLKPLLLLVKPLRLLLVKPLGLVELPRRFRGARRLRGMRLLHWTSLRSNWRSLRCWSHLLRLPSALFGVLHPILVVPHLAWGRTIVAARTLRLNRRRMKRTLAILYGLLGPSRPKPLAILYRPYGSRGNHFHARIRSTRLRLQRGDLCAAQRPSTVRTYRSLLALE